MDSKLKYELRLFTLSVYDLEYWLEIKMPLE